MNISDKQQTWHESNIVSFFQQSWTWISRPLWRLNFPSSSKLGTHLTPTFTHELWTGRVKQLFAPWVKRKIFPKVWQCFTELFDYLPIAASVRRLELPPMRGVFPCCFFFGSLCEVTCIAWVLCRTSGCWNVQDLRIDVRKKHMEKMNLRIKKNTAIFKKLRSFSEPN